MSLKGYKTPDDPLPSQRRQKFTGGGQDSTYRGAYSQVRMGAPSVFNPISQRRPIDGADPFVKSTAASSYESSGVIGSADVPDTGSVNDGRGSPGR